MTPLRLPDTARELENDLPDGGLFFTHQAVAVNGLRRVQRNSVSLLQSLLASDSVADTTTTGKILVTSHINDHSWIPVPVLGAQYAQQIGQRERTATCINRG